MKKVTMLVALALLALVAQAGTIANFKTPSEVTEIVSTAIAEWILKPTDATGCGGADCCPAPATDAECAAFALEVQLNPGPWAMRVAEQLQFDGDWVCNTWPQPASGNNTLTACTTVSGTPIIDVARILSEMADLRGSS